MKASVSGVSAQLWRVAAGTELRRSVLQTYGTRVLVVAVTFATAVVVARELGPTGRGYYAVAATLACTPPTDASGQRHSAKEAKIRDAVPEGAC
jgi:hypothetical protein